MYLIDTNVISELPKAKPNAHVIAWLGTLDRIAISVVTIEELEFGVCRTSGAKGRILRDWYDALLATEPLVIPVDERIARTAGALRAACVSRGRNVAQADTLIGATALVTGRVLATRNTKDFDGCGVPLLNPFG